MATFTRHATVAAPRNGATSHTVGPDGTGGTVVAGSAFTPAAGRVLIVGVDGGVTSTTPSGWTLPTNGSAVSFTGLYVWHRIAAGSDTLSTTHNASDFPVVFDFYEFEVGSTFTAAVSETGTGNGGDGPTLSGLTGSNWTAGVVAQANNSGGTRSFVWSSGVEAADTSVVASGTDGYSYSLTYVADNPASSVVYAATSTDSTALERLVFAVAAVAESVPVAPGVTVELTKVIP